MTLTVAYKAIFAFSMIMFGVVGCDFALKQITGGWHKKFGWNAEKYFTDEKVIQLCKAIEKNDVAEMEKLIKAGANVNAIGMYGMTPLLWAFPDNKLERFECLLKHGADASVPFKGNFNVPQAFDFGCNVSHLSAASAFPNHFISVMKHGGNPNLRYTWPFNIKYERNLFESVFSTYYPNSNKKERCDAIVNAGASKELLANGARTALRKTEWEIALMLLKAGADYKTDYDSNFSSGDRHSTYVEELANKEIVSLNRDTPDERAKYLNLVKWLESQGEDFQAVRSPPIDHSKAEAKQRRLQEQRDKMEKELAPAKKQWERDREKWK